VNARKKFLKAYEREPNNPTIANNLKLLNSSSRFIQRVARSAWNHARMNQEIQRATVTKRMVPSFFVGHPSSSRHRRCPELRSIHRSEAITGSANELILLLIGLFFLYSLASDRWTAAAWNLGLAAGILLFLIYPYARHWMGGGDVKILTVAFLWTGIECALPFVILLLLSSLSTPSRPSSDGSDSQQIDDDHRQAHSVRAFDRCRADRHYFIGLFAVARMIQLSRSDEQEQAHGNPL